MKTFLKITLSSLAAIVVCLVVANIWIRQDKSEKGATFVAPSASISGQAGAAVPKKSGPATIGEGTWEVGVDVKAGKYKTAGASAADVPLCYWHTAKNDSNDSIIDQGVVDSLTEPGRVTLKAGQFFKTSGCQPWVSVK